MSRHVEGGVIVAGSDRPSFSSAIAIIHPRIRGTAIERDLLAASRGTRVAETLQADIVISTRGSTCAFQLHTNFSHGHVTEAVTRAQQLASGFERCYVLLVRPNTDALRNFQDLSGGTQGHREKPKEGVLQAATPTASGRRPAAPRHPRRAPEGTGRAGLAARGGPSARRLRLHPERLPPAAVRPPGELSDRGRDGAHPARLFQRETRSPRAAVRRVPGGVSRLPAAAPTAALLISVVLISVVLLEACVRLPACSR